MGHGFETKNVIKKKYLFRMIFKYRRFSGLAKDEIFPPRFFRNHQISGRYVIVDPFPCRGKSSEEVGVSKKC